MNEPPAYPIICVVCKRDLVATEGWQRGPVVHCTGGKDSIGGRNHAVHHGHRRVLCTVCRRPLGCDACLKKDDPFSYACTCCEVFGDGSPVRNVESFRLLKELVHRFVEGKQDA